MYSFIKTQQLSAAMDVVMKTWARALRLRREDVLVILIVGDQMKGSCSELAGQTGRARQQVHRNLRRLEAKKVVRPSDYSAAGRVLLWQLTERGKQIFEVLRGQVRIWEAHLDRVYELDATVSALRHALHAIVRQTSDVKGWENALCDPDPIFEEEVWALEATTQLLELGAQIQAEAAGDDPDEVCRVERLKRKAQLEREYVELLKKVEEDRTSSEPNDDVHGDLLVEGPSA